MSDVLGENVGHNVRWKYLELRLMTSRISEIYRIMSDTNHLKGQNGAKGRYTNNLNVEPCY